MYIVKKTKIYEQQEFSVYRSTPKPQFFTAGILMVSNER